MEHRGRFPDTLVLATTLKSPPHPRRKATPLHRYAFRSTARFEEAVAVASRLQHSLSAEFSRPLVPFRFDLSYVPLGSLSLCHVRLDYDAAYTITAEGGGEDYHLQLNLAGGGRVRHGREERVIGGRTRGLLLSPGRPTRWRGEGGFREFTVNLERRSVGEHFEALGGRAPSGTIEFEPAFDVTRGGAAVARIVGEIVDRVDGETGLSAMATARYREWLLDALLLGLHHNHSRGLLRRAPAGSRATVRRAEEYIEARSAEPLTIRRVALALGMSIRTLQRSFSRHREYTPKQFLAERRLMRAREMLLDPGPECSVTAAALAAGHSHLGPIQSRLPATVRGVSVFDPPPFPRACRICDSVLPIR